MALQNPDRRQRNAARPAPCRVRDYDYYDYMVKYGPTGRRVISRLP